MMGKSKIYTKTGDKGLTSLVGGKRVPKTHARIEAYGTIDELNSFIGLLIEEVDEKRDRDFLLQIQSILFTAGSYLATEGIQQICEIRQENIDLLENEIDNIDGLLPKLTNFVLPGGSKSAASAHVCRTVCRRAERCIYRVQDFAEVDSLLLIFINRLSDYLFIFARKQCFKEHGQEIIWQKPCK